jgi:hypothetical protein
MGRRCKMGKSSRRKKEGSWKSLLGASGESSGDEESCLKKNAVVEISGSHRFLALARHGSSVYSPSDGWGENRWRGSLWCKVLKLLSVVRDKSKCKIVN